MTVLIENSKSGLPTLTIRDEERGGVSVHSRYDPVREATILVDRLNPMPDDIVVVLGLGLGYHLVELLRRHPKVQVVVVESEAEIFNAFKSRFLEMCSEPRVSFLVGIPWEEALCRITEFQLKSGFGRLKILRLPAETRFFRDYYDNILRKLQPATRYNLKDVLSCKKFKDNILTVGILDFGYFLRRELVSTFKRLGHRVHILEADTKDPAGKMIEKLVIFIKENRPDFLISVNHHGFDEDGVIAGFLDSIDMPVAIWYVDSPRMIINAFRENVRQNKVIFLWEREYLKEARKIGFEHVFYLPLATDEEIFCIGKDKQRIEVGFVGNSMLNPVDTLMNDLPTEARSLAQRYAKAFKGKRVLFSEFLYYLPEHIQEKVRSLSRRDYQVFEAALVQKASQLYRLECVKKLRGFSPVIRGDHRWREVINGKEFKILPPLNYYTETAAFYRSVMVNFNATNMQMPTAVNQRVFDVPACGAFLLTDHQKAIEELFDVGKEVVTYKEPEEVPDLLRYYLRHPAERERIALAARKRVLSEHTYVHRIDNMLKAMRRIFS
ncbi:MAG: hypothetical protein D6726_06375 [Nitrospirae bacterium]|nr:MAG: hypothetical protein D6726_06375 [Nitrospirota bacterium]